MNYHWSNVLEVESGKQFYEHGQLGWLQLEETGIVDKPCEMLVHEDDDYLSNIKSLKSI